jgi:large subunit ribosomal protein L21
MAEKNTKATKKTTIKKPQPAKAKASKKLSKQAVKPGARIAILAINKMQYIVKEGETIQTRIKLDSTEKNIDVKLLGLIEKENFEVGKPYLSNKLDYALGEVKLGDKVITNKFKAKARYRKRTGHRTKFVEFTLKSVK